MDSALSADRYQAHGVLGQIVRQIQLRIFQDQRQLVPQRQRELVALPAALFGSTFF